MDKLDGAEFSLSRRTLIAGGATLAALHFVGVYPHSKGVALAYADDEGATTFVVYVLDRKQIPVIAYDVTDNKRTPVAGMQVTLTSTLDDTSLTVTTDEAGCAVADISSLVDPDSDAGEGAETYAGYVSVAAARSGYRTFIEPSNYVQSGVKEGADGEMPNTLQVPTQPDNGMPYLSCLSLDGSDVQYAKATVGLVASNDMTHDLTFQLEHASAGESWVFALEGSGAAGELGTTTAAANAQGTVQATLEGQWLDGAHGISEGDQVTVSFYRSSQSTPRFELRLPLSFEQRTLLFSDGYTDKHEISPGLGAQNSDDSQEKKESDGDNWMQLPRWLTLTGDSLCLGAPYTPIQIFIDTQNNFGITATLLQCTPYARKDGKRKEIPLADRWKTYNGLSDKWFDTFADDLFDDVEAFLEADTRNEKGNLKAFAGGKWTSSVNVKTTLTAKACGSFSKPQDTSKYSLLAHADAMFIFDFSASYTNSKQFFVFGVPLVFTFDISGAASLTGGTGLKCNEYFQNLTWDPEFYNIPIPTSILVKLHGEVGVSLAFGILGVCTIGIRGYGFIDLSLNTDMTPEEGKIPSYPHVKIQLAGHFQAVIQCLLFKKTFQIDNFPPVVLYDSWKSKDENSERLLFGENMPLPNSARFGSNVLSLAAAQAASMNDMEMVSESALKNTVEQKALLDGTSGCPRSFEITRSMFTHDLSDIGIRDPYANAPEIAGEGPSGGLTTTSAALDAASGNLKAAGGYNPLRGIRPSKQVKLWSGVFSAPHEQVVRAGDTTYLLRLATVELNVGMGDSDLYTAIDKDGCVFVKAKSDNYLPKLSVGEEGLILVGGGLASGESQTYPAKTASNVAHLAGFETLVTEPTGAPGEYTLEQAKALVEALCGTDERGEATNDATVVRTRLTISRFDEKNATWEEPVPIEFELPTTSTEYMRANSWDVDFSAEGFDDGYVYIGLTSIVRPYDQDKSYDEQFDRQFISLLRVKPPTADNPRVAEVAYAWSSISKLATRGESLWYPRVSVCYSTSLFYEKCTQVAVFYFASNEAHEIGAGEFQETSIYFTVSGRVGYWGDGDTVALPEELTNQYFCRGTYGVRMISTDNTEDSIIAFFHWAAPQDDTLPGLEEAVTVVWSYCFCNRRCFSAGHVLKGVNMIAPGPIETAGMHAARARWYYTRASGTSEGGERLMREVTCTAFLPGDWMSSDPVDTYAENWEIGGTEDVTTFGVSEDGKRLYAVRCMEGTMPALDEGDLASLARGTVYRGTYSRTNSPQAELPCTEDTEVQQYQLMCALWDEGTKTFHEFFPIADLDFAADSVHEVPLSASTNRYDFILTSITDIDNNQLDVYHVAVPHVLGLQLEGVGAISKFGMPGDTCRYRVTVANTGNVPIDGFTVALYNAKTDMHMVTQNLTNLENLVQQDNSMLKPAYDDDGVATDVYAMATDACDAAGVLWPGRTRTYASTFPLPDVGGTLTVGASVGAPHEYVMDGAETSSLSDSGETLTCVDPRARLFSMSLDGNATAAADRVGAEYDVITSGGGSDSGSLAKTGDGSLAAVLAALAAAAAATKVALDRETGEESE